MRRTAVILGLIVMLGGGAECARAAAAPVAPFEDADWSTPANAVDAAVFPALAALGIEPALSCSDQVFLRRVFIDLIGTLPQPEEWLAFTTDRSPDKRARLIDSLLEREEFVDYWAMKWCDLLRVKAEFPINLWPNAVQAYHRWVHDAIRDNKPYDQMARELLTSSGSNFRVPPVNFYRAMQNREPAGIAESVALVFMGSRLASWPDDRRAGLAAFFKRVAYKKTAEWKEEIVYLNPAATEPLEAMFPDGTTVTIPPGEDPRTVFARWLIRDDNPYFARCMANRMWFWMFGRGIVHEPDDFRPDNPPSNPKLLDCLADELVRSRYDLRQLLRLICNSRTYQQSSIPQTQHPEGEAQFAWYPVRRQDAEVLADMLKWLTGFGDTYLSMIPEPFTWIPEENRTIELPDGSITSPFLQMFGRPARDTGLLTERDNKPTDAQRLYLLNSSEIQRRIERGGRFHGCVAWAQGDQTKLVAALYVNILSREPTPEETAVALKYFKEGGVQGFQGVADLCWALINSKEFLYRH